jgi:hypothetical protein
MSNLMAAIRRAQAAKRRGGPDGPTGLAIAARLPAVREIANRIVELDPGTDEATALEIGALVRGIMLDALEEELTEGNE